LVGVPSSIVADPTNTPGISDLELGSLAWRTLVARTAHWFFVPAVFLPEGAAIAGLIDKPYQPDKVRRLERQ
jgi:hypothetical protein